MWWRSSLLFLHGQTLMSNHKLLLNIKYLQHFFLTLSIIITCRYSSIDGLGFVGTPRLLPCTCRYLYYWYCNTCAPRARVNARGYLLPCTARFDRALLAPVWFLFEFAHSLLGPPWGGCARAASDFYPAAHTYIHISL